MDIFSVITLMGGLSFFLFGMHVMSTGLERIAGGKLEYALKKMTSTPLKSLLLGAGITVAIQSSSAMTVMLVGLVNSGIMDIGQTVGIIMGSNIGTTLTAWLLALVGIESESIWLRLLKPENFSLVFALIGVILLTFSKKDKRRDIGSILVAFAVLMFGMKLMSNAVSPLADMPEFVNLLTVFKNPVIGVLVGALFTGIIQSSAASVGILQALALTGSISYGMAIPIIMGQNIGTCVTALISSIGVSKNAKKVSVLHIAFNMIGTTVLLILFYGANAIFRFSFVETAISAPAIAAVHSVFNIATTIMLLPFSKQLVRLTNRLLPDDESKKEPKPAMIDARLFATPSVAISECNAKTSQMTSLAHDTLCDALSLLEHFDEKKATNIVRNEDILDRFEDELGTALVQLSAKHLSDEDSLKISRMLHAIGDLERLGDHAVNLLDSAKELKEKNLYFSESAQKELGVLKAALEDILSLATSALQNNDEQQAQMVEPLEQVIDGLVSAVRSRHITRLKNGECSIELGFILSDLLGNFERISDHCSNLAVAVIELKHHAFDTHKYLKDVKYDDPTFKALFRRFEEKYSI